ncbi:MAG: hypothetical protein HOP29_10145 [Phycisphaerales bacterium]|nr:hypothetical protein [Phycisphaerales bacterium]
MQTASPTSIHNPAAICQSCGAPAAVHVTAVADGAPTVRHYCHDCADHAHLERAQRRRYHGAVAAVGSIGVVVLSLSVFADWLQFGRSEGFGRYQQVGVILGFLLVSLGAAARAPTLFIVGAFTVVLSLLADLFGFGCAEGFGWQQVFGSLLGTAIIISAIVVARKHE